MSKIDDKYIKALSDFTGALEQIVAVLKSQQKNNKADTVNDMLKNVPDTLNNVVNELKKVNSGLAEVKNTNNEILRKIESVKKQKESGMFDRIEDPKNKNKIVDGIKVVILIAAGVLALGMAFKIIGKVDFLSVMALSGSIVLMSIAFSKLAENKNLKFSQVLLISAMLPLMALGIALSGAILHSFPKFGLAQGLSILFISGALGVASYLLLNALSKIHVKSLLMIPLLPFILPLIALGLVKSSIILAGVQQLSFAQVLSIGLVGLALGVATYGIGLALRGMKNITWKEMIALPLMIPLIAGGIVLASMVFQKFIPLKTPSQILIGSAVIGLSMLAFAPAIWILGSMNYKDLIAGTLVILPLVYMITKASAIFQSFVPLKAPLQLGISSLFMGLALLSFAPSILLLGKMSLKDLLKGALIILPLAFLIVKASTLFQDFVPLKNPLQLGISSLAIGMSILFFTPAVLLLGKMSMKDLITGSIGVLFVAGTILATAYIFTLLPSNMVYPPLMWTLGAGLSILAFGALSVALGAIMTLTAGIGFGALALGMASILLIAGTIVGTSIILGKGDYSKYPSLDWALGVGGSLIAFSYAAILAAGAGLVSLVSKFFTGEDPLIAVAKSMVNVSKELESGNWKGNYPSKDWALGVGTSLILFSAATVLAGGVSLITSIFAWFDNDEDPLVTLSISMVNVSKELEKGKWGGNYPKEDWALGVGTSLILFATVTALAGGTALLTSIFAWFDEDEEPLLTLAISMVNVSKEIQKGKWGGNYPSVDWALGVGTSLTLFATVTALAGGVGLLNSIFAWFDQDEDPLMTLAISMVKVSEKLQKGNWGGNYPSVDWALSVGTALTLFATATATSGGMSLLTNIFAWFDEDNDPLMKITLSMVDISKKLQEGNWGGNYPKLDWATGVGTSLMLFATATATAGGMNLLTDIFAWFSKDEKDGPLLKVAKSMVEISNTLQGGNWGGNYPKLDWAGGVGTALTLFATATATAGGMSLITNVLAWLDEDSDPLMKIAKSMVDISNTLQGGNWGGNYPKLDWASGVGTTLTLFATATTTAGGMSLITNVLAWLDEDSDPLMKITISMVEISKKLQDGKWDGNYPKLDWATGVGTALMLFASATVTAAGGNLVTDILNFFTDTNDPLLKLVTSMVTISTEIQKGKWEGNYPKEEWAKGVGQSVKLFAEATASLRSESSSILDMFSGDDPLFKLASSMIEISNRIDEGKWNGNYPKEDWSKGVGGALKLFAETTAFAKDQASIFDIFKSKDTLKNLATSMVEVSNILDSGKYDNFPSKAHIGIIGYFVETISKVVDENNINNNDAIKFSQSTTSITPAIKTWMNMLSDSDYTTIPSKAYTKNLSFYLLSIGETIKDFASLKITIQEFVDFNRAIKLMIPSLNELDNLPDINTSTVKNMKSISEVLKELAIGVDSFMYEDYGGLVGGIITFFAGGKKRSMDDFVNFSIGLSNLVHGLQVLTTLSPMQGGITKGYIEFLGGLKDLPELPDLSSKAESINKLATSFVTLADALSKVNTNLDGFSNLYKGLSINIDEKNLLKTVDKSNLKITNNSAEDKSNLVIKPIINKSDSEKEFDDALRQETSKPEKEAIQENKSQNQFYTDIADIKKILYEIRDTIDRPEPAESFYK